MQSARSHAVQVTVIHLLLQLLLLQLMRCKDKHCYLSSLLVAGVI
jgi:hypothetical protein